MKFAPELQESSRFWLGISWFLMNPILSWQIFPVLPTAPMSSAPTPASTPAVLTLPHAQGGAARAACVRTASCSVAMSAFPCPTVAAATMESITKRGRHSTPHSRRCASASLVALWSAKILPVLMVTLGRSSMVSSSVLLRCLAPAWPQVTAPMSPSMGWPSTSLVPAPTSSPRPAQATT